MNSVMIIVFILPSIILSSIINIKGTEMLSKETKEYLNVYPISISNNSLTQKIFHDEIEVNKSIDVNISFPLNNGDIGVGPMELYGLIYNKNIKSLKEYYSINYITSPDGYIENINSFNINSSIINCTYTSYNASRVIITKKKLQNKYNKIMQYLQYSIGLFRNSLYDLQKNSILKSNDIIMNTTIQLINVIDYWVIKQQFAIEAYLVILKETENSIVINKINAINDNLVITFYHEIQTQVGVLELNNIIINDFWVYKSISILGTDQGIFFIEINKGNVIVKIDNQLKELKIANVIVINDTLYAIGLKKGLIIINMLDRKNIIQHLHSNMMALDYVINPFTGLIFLGVYLDSSSSDDFFIELLIDNPLLPSVNKVYLLKGNTIALHSTPDSFYTYFNNKNENKIYRIRRSILHSIPTSIDSIALLETNIASMTKYYDDKHNRVFPAIVTDSHLIAFDYNKTDDQLQCRFNHSGSYTLVYDQLTDSCSSNVGKEALACQKIHFKQFNVLGNNPMDTSIIIICILIPAIFVIALTLIIIYWKEINCFVMRKLRIVDVNKNDRIKLYQCNVDHQSNTTETHGQRITSTNKLNSIQDEEDHYTKKKIIINYNKKTKEEKSTTSSRNDRLLVIADLIPSTND